MPQNQSQSIQLFWESIPPDVPSAKVHMVHIPLWSYMYMYLPQLKILCEPLHAVYSTRVIRIH